MTRWTLAAIGMSLMLCGTALWSDEAEELRDRVNALRKEAAALAEKGQAADAKRLEHEAQELAARLKKSTGEQKQDVVKKGPVDLEPQIQKLESHLQALAEKHRQLETEKGSDEARAAVREHMEAARRQLEELHALRQHRVKDGGGKHERVAEGPELAERIMHLRAAAEHLRHADAHELAGQLLEKARNLEQAAQPAKDLFAKGEKHPEKGEPGGLGAQVEELRRELQRLRAEVEELRRVKK